MNLQFYKKLFLLFTFGICFFVILPQISAGQVKDAANQDEYVYPDPPNLDDLSLYGIIGNNCESVRVDLENVLAEAKRKSEAYFIIIVRLEKGERAGLYELRKKELKKWLDDYYQGKYTIASGEPVKEIGRADLFIGGKIALGLGFRKNSGKICQDSQ